MSDLDKLFSINERKSFALSQLIYDIRSKHPADRLHFISHMQGKLKDPNHHACIEDLEKLCDMILQNFTVDQVKILIEEVMPSEQDMALLAFMESLSILLGGTKKEAKH